MNSVAILGSARKNSNAEAILTRLIAGYACDVVGLDTCPISFFNYEFRYPADDQFLTVIQRVVRAPVTIIATPVYWYSYSTPMKIFIDRFSDLLGPQKELGRQLRSRRFALVTSSSEPMPDKTLVEAFSRFCGYLGIEYLGCAHAEGAGEFVDSYVVEKIQGCLDRI